VNVLVVGEISAESWQKNRYAASQISAMEVRCATNLNIPGGDIESSERCNFQGSLSSMYPHLNDCPFETEKCPNAIYMHSGDIVQGCSEIIQRRNLETHTGQCAHRLVFCELCNEEVRKFQLELHRLQMCLMRPTVCPNNGCVDIVAFSKLNEHRDNCAFELLPCSRTTACLERTKNNLKETTTNELRCKKMKLEPKTGEDQKIKAEIVVGSQVRIRNMTVNEAREIFIKADPRMELAPPMIQLLGKNGIVFGISIRDTHTRFFVDVEGMYWNWPDAMLEAK